MIVYEFSFVFWLDFLTKGRNQQNLGNFGGPTPRRKDAMQQRRSTPMRGMSTCWCG